ncbi:MAG: transketolase C-terminal domain-containing protein [Clostridia bacterium]|nr:transketolase C-terminal domain-containing protein [Clostridia bacterium]
MKTCSTREAAMRALIEAARDDEKLLIVSPDSILAARAVPFMKEFPDRLVEVGIAEQNAVDVAAGLAACGMKPVVITYAGFLTMRACEMMRTFVAYPGLNVKFIGLNGGMLGGEREGVTHQFYEDLGILRSMPGIAILTPSDGHQAYKAAKSMLSIDGPAYLRLASGREPEVFDDAVPFEYGRVREVMRLGSDVAVFASGYIMNRAIDAVRAMKADGIGATLVEVSTLKPLDEPGVAEVLANVRAAVTVEDHNIYGALGSAICEAACKYHPLRVERVGLPDVYPRSGCAEELLSQYGLSVQDIIAAAKRALQS